MNQTTNFSIYIGKKPIMTSKKTVKNYIDDEEIDDVSPVQISNKEMIDTIIGGSSRRAEMQLFEPQEYEIFTVPKAE